jgi:hypothetical protein
MLNHLPFLSLNHRYRRVNESLERRFARYNLVKNLIIYLLIVHSRSLQVKLCCVFYIHKRISNIHFGIVSLH